MLPTFGIGLWYRALRYKKFDCQTNMDDLFNLKGNNVENDITEA